MAKKILLEIVQDFDGSYYANLSDFETLKFIDGLPQYVDFNTLKEAIRMATSGVIIPKRKELLFNQAGSKKYAYVNNCIQGDCRQEWFRTDVYRQQYKKIYGVEYGNNA